MKNFNVIGLNFLENALLLPLKISFGKTELPRDFDIFFPLSVSILV